MSYAEEIKRLKEKKTQRLKEEKEKKELEKLRREEEPTFFDKIKNVVEIIDNKLEDKKLK